MTIKYLNNNISLIYKGKCVRRQFKLNENDNPILPDKPVYNPVPPQAPITDNVNEIPYIITYHYEPTMDVNKDVIIPLYFTDYRQREYLYDDADFYNFKLRVQIDDNSPFYISDLKAGDYDLNLGKLSKGEHHYNLEVTDQFNRTSCRLFKLFRLVDPVEYAIKPSETYTITNNDLSKHNIKNNNSQVVEDMINCRVGLTALFKEIRDNGYRKCILPKGIYRVNRTISGGSDDQTSIKLPSGLTIDMNGSTFKLHPYDDRTYGDIGNVGNVMVEIIDCIDTHLINGVLEGDYADRQSLIWTDGSNAIDNMNGQHNNALNINGGRYNSVENIKLTQITGYSMSTSFGKVIFERPNGNDPVAGLLDGIGIDDNGDEYEGENLCSTVFKDITNFIDNELTKRYVSCSAFLGMCMPRGKHWDYKMSFYDENRNFIESFKVQQFRVSRIPPNAKYARATFKGTKEEVNPWEVVFHNRPSADYCAFKNIEAIDNRTCITPARFTHLTMENINFTRSGQSITPLAIDLEDGWEEMQDFYLRNCKVKEKSGTRELVVCAGLNIQVENCPDFRVDFRYRINGLTVRNNKNLVIDNSFGWMTENTIRVYNNENMSFGYLNSTGYIRDQLILFKNNSYKGTIALPATGDGHDAMYRMSGKTFIDTVTKQYSEIRYGDIYITTNLVYMEGGKYYNCNFYKGELNTETFTETLELRFTAYDVQRYFYDCIFHNPCIIKENAKNTWLHSRIDRCIFKSDLEIYANGIDEPKSDVVFNDCIFEGNMKFTVSNHNMIFNNCTVKGKVTYMYGCESSVIWNN